jgi:hypothetical protein
MKLRLDIIAKSIDVRFLIGVIFALLGDVNAAPVPGDGGYPTFNPNGIFFAPSPPLDAYPKIYPGTSSPAIDSFMLQSGPSITPWATYASPFAFTGHQGAAQFPIPAQMPPVSIVQQGSGFHHGQFQSAAGAHVDPGAGIAVPQGTHSNPIAPGTPGGQVPPSVPIAQQGSGANHAQAPPHTPLTSKAIQQHNAQINLLAQQQALAGIAVPQVPHPDPNAPGTPGGQVPPHPSPSVAGSHASLGSSGGSSSPNYQTYQLSPDDEKAAAANWAKIADRANGYLDTKFDMIPEYAEVVHGRSPRNGGGDDSGGSRRRGSSGPTDPMSKMMDMQMKMQMMQMVMQMGQGTWIFIWIILGERTQ